jgi:hypothetical protein
MSPRIPSLRACGRIVAIALIAVPSAARAQDIATAAFGSAETFVSASGATTFGFAPGTDSRDVPTAVDVTAILPPGSFVAPAVKRLVEQLWLASPTFRRQCARLRQGPATVAISLDFPRHKVNANAESEISRGPGLHASIHLRAADASVVEHLAHEIEHVLEQLDGVDLPLAVAKRLSGASFAGRAGTFETARAIAIGRLVAREVEDMRNWR